MAPPQQEAALPPPPAPVEPVPEAPPPPPVEPSVPAGDLVDTGGRTDIAILLPLSGPNAALGRELLNAADLALNELGSDDMVLTPKDTHGTPDGAVDAAHRAVAEGAKLVIGPLTAGEVEAMKPIVQQAGIDTLAFSNQAKVAGDGVFVLGFLPDQEVKRIIDYAHSTGLQHFALLAPSSPYGQLVAQSFRDSVAAAGATLDDVEYYDPGQNDLRPVIQTLSAGGKFTFTALLVPATSSPKLKLIASLLPVYSIAQPQIRLLGTASWDLPNLGTEPGLVGGWFAAPPPEARARFEQQFAKAFGHKPQRLATLAYDAVGIAAVLHRTPGGSFSTEALTNPSGFAGADGIFRLLPDGTTERGLAVLQVDPGGVSVVSPAIDSFQQAAP